MRDLCSENISTSPCPTGPEEAVRAFLALLPHGWAWDAGDDPGTLMGGRARVVGYIMDDVIQKACALLAEFHCDTMSQTQASWFADYGLPDDCGYSDLCAKVTAIGDGTCASLIELGAQSGFDICCTEFPIEMQVGGWNLGCDQMAPAPVYLGGGSELGFACLGLCPPEAGVGSALGEDDDDCRIVGYFEADADNPVSDPPCDLDIPQCQPYSAPCTDTFTIGKSAPWDISHYTGTAYAFGVGTEPNSVALTQDSYPMVGSFEMGCVELCVPPVDPMFCFVLRHRQAHTLPLRIQCD